MPQQPALPPGAQGGFNLDNAPGGDIDFATLFNEKQPEGQTPSQPPAQPAAGTPPQDEVYLRASSGTVYKTREEAERGTAHRDAIIKRLRDQVIQSTGRDPLKEDTTQPAAQPAAQPQPGQPVRYMEKPEVLYQKMANAASKQDSRQWVDSLAEFVYELIDPAAPLILDSAKDRAINRLEAKPELAGIRQFLSGPAYQEVVDRLPLIRQAITEAESRLALAPQLDQLYESVYLTAKGLHSNPAQAQPANQPQPQPTARSTVSTSTPAPPSPAALPDLRTPEGRKALIAQYEAQGMKDVSLDRAAYNR
jgi:hypothetical protein